MDQESPLGAVLAQRVNFEKYPALEEFFHTHHPLDIVKNTTLSYSTVSSLLRTLQSTFRVDTFSHLVARNELSRDDLEYLVANETREEARIALLRSQRKALSSSEVLSLV